MFKKYSDSTLIEGIRRQEEKVINWLYDNYFQTVRHHVMQNNGSEADVSDVFQESIITLYKQVTENNLKLETDLKGYFFGIAKNIWSAQLRKKLKNTEIEVDIADISDAEDDKNSVLEKILTRAFQKLKPDAQTVLKLYSEGLSYEEIAIKMNLKNEVYARRKKYLSKEILLELVKSDPEYKDYFDL